MKKKKLYKILDELTDGLMGNNGCLDKKITPKAIAVDLVFIAYAVLDRHYNLHARYQEEAIFDLKRTLKILEEDVKNGEEL